MIGGLLSALGGHAAKAGANHAAGVAAGHAAANHAAKAAVVTKAVQAIKAANSAVRGSIAFIAGPIGVSISNPAFCTLSVLAKAGLDMLTIQIRVLD